MLTGLNKFKKYVFYNDYNSNFISMNWQFKLGIGGGLD